MAKRKKITLALAGCRVYKGKPFKSREVYAEKKLDGYRGVIIFKDNKGKAYTHHGCKIINAKKIISAMEKSKVFKDVVLDGEFLCRGNWNDTSSVVMKQSKHKLARKLMFNVFDCISLKEFKKKKCSKTLAERKNELSVQIGKLYNAYGIKKGKKLLGYVDHIVLKNPSEKDVRKFMEKQVAAGNEGCVLKESESYYAFKKSNDWLKLKPEQDADLKIVGAKPGKGKFKGLIGSIDLIGEFEGTKVKVNCSGMTDEKRKELTQLHKKNKLVGHCVEIHHEGLTKKNSLRFPRFYRMRKDKD